MSVPRQLEGANNQESEQNNTSEDELTRIFQLTKGELEVLLIQTVERLIGPVMEHLVRRIVKEKLEFLQENLMTSIKCKCTKQLGTSESRSLQLKFLDKISLPVFTGKKIKGEGYNCFRLALVDILTEEVVKSGPEAAANVELMAIEEDSSGDGGDNWTVEDFNNKIVRARKGKKSLLKGNTCLNLKEGISNIGDISFIHNSGWMKRRELRLVARVVDDFPGTTIKATKTESFTLRDSRTNLYVKNHPPSLSDEVWRLEKIGRKGAFRERLSRENITTVKDFLRFLVMSPQRLKEILGTGMSAKMWEVTVEHARSCVLDKRLYLYRPRSQEKTGVVFNVVGQVMGLLSDCQYVPADKLSETEKADAHKLVILAFKQWEEVVSLDDDTSLVDGFSLLSNVLYPSNSPMAGSSDSINILTSVKDVSFDYPQLSASTPDVYSLGCARSMDGDGIRGIESIDVRFDQTSSFPNQAANSLICDTESVTHALFEDEHLQYFDTDCSLQNHVRKSQADQCSGVDVFLYAHSAAAVAIVKAHRRWTILFSVLRWFSIRRIVARKLTLETHIVDEARSNKFRSEMQI